MTQRKLSIVTKTCEICGDVFEAVTGLKRGEKRTCSYSCSNKLFRSGDKNGMRRKRQMRLEAGEIVETYAEICWTHHQKRCVVCDESNVVAVHHYNEDHNDNRPENLVPLCPTHHLYMHSKHREKIDSIVSAYVENFRGVA